MMGLSRLRLVALAIALTAAIVLLANIAADLAMSQRPFENGKVGFIDAPDVAILHFIFTGLPFFALAGCGEQRRTFWTTAVALTLVSWIYAIWQLWQDSLTGFAGGADIGLGLIMMAAPIVIAVVITAASLVSNPPAA
jgi:hypothetical protein